jgi:2-keto-3-deoxy-6-phosphogluconate aldolase
MHLVMKMIKTMQALALKLRFFWTGGLGDSEILCMAAGTEVVLVSAGSVQVQYLRTEFCFR